MGLKNFFGDFANWFGLSQQSGNEIKSDTDNMLSSDALDADYGEDDSQESGQLTPWASRRKVKGQSIEKLEEGFNNLIKQLEGINEHLDKTVSQQNELMKRIERLPTMLETFPDYVENQKQLNEQVLDELRSNGAKEEQLIEAVQKLPVESARQNEALADINRQLSTVADADTQMTENFHNFKESLDLLNKNTSSQTENLEQLNKNFEVSDKDLKYLISVQNRRFLWIFITALSVCVVVILLLIGTVIYINK